MKNTLELAVNPVVLDTLGESFSVRSRILAVIWQGTTTAGDTAELWSVEDEDYPEALIWAGQAADTNTYQGVNLGPVGIKAPGGFYAKVLDAGRLIIYLREQ